MTKRLFSMREEYSRLHMRFLRGYLPDYMMFEVIISLEWKVEDMWIGCYWKRRQTRACAWVTDYTYLWLCLIPCFPLMIRFGLVPDESELDY
jgi:hypothetical protein